MNATAARLSVLLVGIATALGGCGEEKPADTTPNARPVTVFELQTTDPVHDLQITGAAKPWKEQDVSFEVSGPVEVVVEAGTNLTGRWDERGTVRVEGGQLARLDTREYGIARDVAAAGLEVARKQLERARIELEKVLPADLAAARAQRDRAAAEYSRYKQAREDDSVSELDLIRATADRDGKQARFEQAEAAFFTQRAEIASREAGVKEATEKLGSAEYDIQRCTLFAPFDAEVSEVYVEAGGYAQAGQPVAHLVMMNPIKVDIAVAPETAARLRYGDNVKLFLPGQTEPYPAVVYEKSTVADAETRTFRISILTRNRRVLPGFEPDDPRLAYPLIPRGFYLMRLREGGLAAGPLMVEENRCLRKDEQGHYVWAAPDIKLGEQDLQGRVITLRKFRIEVGEYRRNFQGIYLFREVTDPGNLPVHSFIGRDVPDDFAGGKVVVARREWQISPGQLVPVYLGIKPPAPGLYVPMDALKPIDEKTAHLFVAKDGKAHRVKVNLVETAGELFGVAAAEAAGKTLLVPGARVIADNIHFLQDGEPVQAVRVVEARR